MAKSPGHQKWPEHKVHEEHAQGRMEVFFNGEKIADSTDVIKVVEDGYPPRFYFLRADVRMDTLEPSEETSQCPFKGTARYYSVMVGGRKAESAVWSYEDPYDEHQNLKGRLAFHDEKMDEIRSLTA